MRQVYAKIGSVARSMATVFITGESGTGKELCAQAVHDMSNRAQGPFVPLNCGAIPSELLESEVFGHVKGSFTGAISDKPGAAAAADGGTLFLDEIGHLPLAQQLKILRTLETGEFERVGSSRTHRANVRLIAATNANLEAEIAAGRFRQDLFFRLNTIRLHLPALRERTEDIEPLARHFLERHAAHHGKSLTGFDEHALQSLHAHRWPGNVRELDHAIERAVLMADSKVVQASHLGLSTTTSAPSLEDMNLCDVEACLIRKTLARCNGNARQAAAELGLSRSAFYRRIEKYGL